MIRRWRAFHVFSASLDALLVDVVGPFIESHAEQLERAFWERHYAGGPHVRVRFSAAPGHLNALASEFQETVRPWLAAHREPSDTGYSPARAAALLRLEGIDPASEDLEHRENAIVERVYPEPGKAFASAGARDLIERFRCERGPIALQIISSREPREEQMFRLYLMLALFVGRGRFPVGSVSFKSHWEHFAAARRSNDALRRIDSSYERHRDRLAAMMAEVERHWHGEDVAEHPVLAQWRRLLEDMQQAVTEVLARGEQLASLRPRASAGDPAAEGHRDTVPSSAFVATMWADARYLSAAARAPSFLRPRALVNLLYDLVAAVGLSPLQKMMLCHHAYRVVEDGCDCNLNDVMVRNIAAAVHKGSERPADGGTT